MSGSIAIGHYLNHSFNIIFFLCERLDSLIKDKQKIKHWTNKVAERKGCP
jgi:hypothetical protein